MAVARLDLAPDIAEIPRLLDWVETCCGEADVDADIVFKLTLSIDEAVVNVINHAFGETPPPHQLSVELTIEPQWIRALVIDNGPPFDPSAVPEADATLALHERHPGGLGIHLIRKMMDSVAYHRVGGENQLQLEKKRA